MDFNESFESLRRLKQELRHDDNELRVLLNKKDLSSFELDMFMNKGS